jgi:thioredoxin reductase (NADPH)
MSEPFIFVVDEDPESLATLSEALQRRFGAEYRVIANADPTTALTQLAQTCEQSGQVALVIASDLDWLARAHALCPKSSRCLLVSFGDTLRPQRVRHALTRGEIDTYLLKPHGDPEERVYPVVGEILGRWVRLSRPRVPVLSVVGERWALRSHELRDLLERSTLSYQFHAHDSEEGQRLLRKIGCAGPFSVVIFRDQFLVDPTNSAIARMLGVQTEPDGGLYDVIVGAGPAGLAAPSTRPPTGCARWSSSDRRSAARRGRAR